MTAPNPNSVPRHLYLLVTSPRLPAGLLTARAWQLLADHPVLAAAETELVTAIRASGLEVEICEGQKSSWVARFQEAATSGRGAVWVAGPEGDQEFATALGHAVLQQHVANTQGRSSQPPQQLEVVYGSWDPPGARLLDVVAVMDKLRSPGGCPWDAEQTHTSLMPYLLEEAYEAYDAIESGDREAMIEELGDVLLQTVFHARLAEESPEPEQWNIDDVAGGLVAKLVRRHPHIFADGTADTPEAVASNWEQIKREEKNRTSAIDGVARAQPALSLAAKYLAKAQKFQLPVTAPQLPAGITIPQDAEELGDLLLAITGASSQQGLDAEAALRAAADRLAGQIRALEASAE